MLSLAALMPPCMADHATDDYTIIPERDPKQSILTLDFERESPDSPELLIAIVNYGVSDHTQIPQAIEMDDVKHVAHLTGWFVIHQKSQELWIGMQMNREQRKGSLMIELRGLLTEDVQGKYHLSLTPKSPSLRHISGPDSSLIFARLRGIEIRVPKWANAPLKADKWDALGFDDEGRKRFRSVIATGDAATRTFSFTGKPVWLQK